MNSISPLRSGCLQVLIPLVLILPLVLSLERDSAIEDCFDIKHTTELDINWVNSVKPWYYPLMSRSELHHFAAGLLQQNPEDIPENDVYYKSCSAYECDSKSCLVTGFGGKRKSYRMKLKHGLHEVDFLSPDSDEKLATCYPTLTDNKSYFFFACCYHNDHQMSWGVSSTNKTLPDETIKMIHKHAEGLGFKKEHFTGLRYDTC